MTTTIITIPFFPSVLSEEVIKQEFTGRITEHGFSIAGVQVWAHEMPLIVKPGVYDFEWHPDYTTGLLAVWASVFNTEIRDKETETAVITEPNSISIFSDKDYEHRVPPAVQTGVGVRWFARAYI